MKDSIKKNPFKRFVNSISSVLNHLTNNKTETKQLKNTIQLSIYSKKTSPIDYNDNAVKNINKNYHHRFVANRKRSLKRIKKSISKENQAITQRKTLTTSSLMLKSFKFLSVLGRGQYGKVFLVQFKPNNKYFAVKAIKKEQILIEDCVNIITSEKKVFEIINQSRHPFLVQLMASFQTFDRVFFVIEYASGGDLITNILKEKFYSQKRTCFYASCIVLALKFLHKNNILYRDLKLDNLLLDKDGYIKLTDFGICKTNIAYGDRTFTFCGTDDYMAPEILLHQSYSRAVDWWALGIIIYEMLVGKLPFATKFQRLNRNVSYPRHVSTEARDLVDRLLFKIDKKRLGSSKSEAEEVKIHSFFKQIDWDRLLNKRIRAPFKPEIKARSDVSNFGKQFTKEDPCLTPLNNVVSIPYENQIYFKDFDFVADCF